MSSFGWLGGRQVSRSVWHMGKKTCFPHVLGIRLSNADANWLSKKAESLGSTDRIKETRSGNRCRTAKYPHKIEICTPIRQEVWSIVRPFLVHLIAHLAMFCLAEVSLAVMLILTCGMLFFCDCLFGWQEIYIKIMCVTVEVILTLYFMKFTPFKTPRVTPF
jgi:hypothetical protein